MSIVCKNSSNQTIEKLYQWDINYDIYITGVDMSSTPLCHFCNRRSKVAYVVAPEADNGRLKVTIPNALLAEPDTIFLYLYYNTTGNTNRTVYVISFPVVPRQKPQNYAAIDNYLSVEMIDQAIMEYIQEAAEQITDGLVSRVEALETSTSDISDELTDIREGYDGTEYQSAGDAVRAIGAALAEIDTVHDVHVFENWQDYYDNIGPIYPGDFIVVHNTGKVVVRMMGEDGTVQPMFIADTNGYIKPDTGIPFEDLSEDLQDLITGEGGEIVVSTNKTYGFNSMSAYETFILEYPDTIKDGDYIWINESTPTTQKYTLYHLYNGTLQVDFIIHNALYINVSIEDDELVVDKTLAQIRTALTQNRDLVLITETGVPIELSDISYTGGVASEVQFTAVTYNGVCHILTTYIIDNNGLATKSQNLTLAGVKDIIVRGPVTGGYEILSIPDVFSNLSEVIDGAVQGLDVRMTVVHDPHYYRVSRHPFTTILEPGDTMVFAGYESVDEDGYNKTVLATYSVSPNDQYVTRTEYHIDNDDVPSGGGSGAKTTWCGTCSTATGTAAKTVSLSGYALEGGSVVNITFENAVNANATLNINSTGAKSIYYHGAAINSGIIGAGATALMFYDGTHYCLISTDYTYIKPSTGIPKTDLAQTVQDAIDLGHKAVVTYTDSTGTVDVAPSAIATALAAGYDIVLQEVDGGAYEIPLSFVNSDGTVAVFSGIIRDSSAGTAKTVMYYINSQQQATKTTSAVGGSVTWSSILPSGGIPATDLASAVQTSLGKADSALQSALYIVTLSTSSSGYTADHTSSEINTAHTAGKVVILKDPIGLIYTPVSVSSSSVDFSLAIAPNSTSISNYGFNISSSTVTANSVTVTDPTPTVVTNSSATPSSLAATANTIYKYTASALTSLTISSIPASGDFVIKFVSGSTATTLITPSGLHMPDDFTAPEANTRYEINVSDGYALVASWGAS